MRPKELSNDGCDKAATYEVKLLPRLKKPQQDVLSEFLALIPRNSKEREPGVDQCRQLARNNPLRESQSCLRVPPRPLAESAPYGLRAAIGIVRVAFGLGYGSELEKERHPEAENVHVFPLLTRRYPARSWRRETWAPSSSALTT